MHFNWVACQPDCRGWVSARSASSRQIVRGSSTSSRADASSAARPSCWIPAAARSTIPSRSAARFRSLGALTTVGTTVRHADRRTATARAWRRKPIASRCACSCCCRARRATCRDAAHVRVHQIWMGDRADDAKAASYTAQDLMIVERDIGRLAKYTFDMGGTGDLLSLALSVPPWEDLHELSRGRIAADQSRHDRCGRRRAAAQDNASVPMAEAKPKPTQDRFVSSARSRATRRPQPAQVDQDRRSRGSDRRHCARASSAAAEVSSANRMASSSAKADDPVRRSVLMNRDFPAY